MVRETHHSFSWICVLAVQSSELGYEGKQLLSIHTNSFGIPPILWFLKYSFPAWLHHSLHNSGSVMGINLAPSALPKPQSARGKQLIQYTWYSSACIIRSLYIWVLHHVDRTRAISSKENLSKLNSFQTLSNSIRPNNCPHLISETLSRKAFQRSFFWWSNWKATVSH